jgi:DnaJ-class molecular chaperone
MTPCLDRFQPPLGDAQSKACPTCDGEGQVRTCMECDGRGGFEAIDDCDVCEGTGEVAPYECPECRGEGEVPMTEDDLAAEEED